MTRIATNYNEIYEASNVGGVEIRKTFIYVGGKTNLSLFIALSLH